MKTENPVKGTIARAELGKPGPPIGSTRYAALKRFATELGVEGVSGTYVLVSKLRKVLIENPNFSELQIYKRGKVQRFQCPRCNREVSKYPGMEKLRWHMNLSGAECK